MHLGIFIFTMTASFLATASGYRIGKLAIQEYFNPSWQWCWKASQAPRTCHRQWWRKSLGCTRYVSEACEERACRQPLQLALRAILARSGQAVSMGCQVVDSVGPCGA